LIQFHFWNYDNTDIRIVRIRYTEHIEEQGERLFKELEAMRIEGMVCKRKDSVYAFTRKLNTGISIIELMRAAYGAESVPRRIGENRLNKDESRIVSANTWPAVQPQGDGLAFPSIGNI
jgi:hypothetical protein